VACCQRSSALVCDRAAHVDDFKLVRLQPSNLREVRDAMYDSDEEIEAGTGGQAMAEDVQARENVACISDNLDNPFWLMLVDKPCIVVVESITTGWGNSFHARDVVIRGFWYERLKPGSRSYYLRTDKPNAYILSHLVLASKFSLPPTVHFVKGSYASYELGAEASIIISNALDQVRLLSSE
jgi:hypothetical protein